MTAATDYASKLEVVRARVATLQRLIGEHAERQGKTPDNWGYSGDMGHVSEKLAELIAFIH